MCKRLDSIERMDAAAAELERVCKVEIIRQRRLSRRPGPLPIELLADASTARHPPSPPPEDFDDLLNRIH